MLDILKCAVNISNSTSGSVSLLNNVMKLLIMISDDSMKWLEDNWLMCRRMLFVYGEFRRA